jgi:putative ABC transport system permease protein
MRPLFSQVFVITLVNLSGVRRRIGASMATIVGIAGVVIVLVSVLSIAQGFRTAMTSSGDADTAIVMRAASPSEDSSIVERDDAAVIKDAPGVMRDAGGPIASAEVHTIVDVARKSTGTLANAPLRGVEQAAFAVRGDVRIVDGRRFEPGRNEVIVGRAAARQFEGLDVGRVVQWGANTWTVVGVFEAHGVTETELWADVGVVQSAYRRGTMFNAVYVKLDSPDAFAQFEEAVLQDPRLGAMVRRESDYLAEQSSSTTRLITTIGFGVAALIAVGAVFGAVNTMYGAVAARTREIATLRAIGFQSLPVAVSVLVEVAILAAAGGAIGGAAAWAIFDGFQASTLNQQTSTQVAFAFDVTPTLLMIGAISALVTGLLGGLLPAVHAARQSITVGLREL